MCTRRERGVHPREKDALLTEVRRGRGGCTGMSSGKPSPEGTWGRMASATACERRERLAHFLCARKGGSPSPEGDSRWKVCWWGDAPRTSDDVDTQMRGQLRTRRAKAEAPTKCSCSVHQWQKQNDSSFKITSISDIASVSKAEAWKARGYQIEGRQGKHVCVALTAVMTNLIDWLSQKR